MNLTHKVILLSALFLFAFSQNSFSQDVSGDVENANGETVIEGYVVLVSIDDESREVVLEDWDQISNNGSYRFSGQRSDTGYIIGFPEDPWDFVPTYYPSGLDWSDATTLYPDVAYTNCDIVVQEPNGTDNWSSSGSHYISGSIISKDFLSRLPAISDATVFIKQNGQLLTYIRSDLSGNFGIDLSEGAYEVTVSKFGYQKEVRNIVINNTIKMYLNFELDAVAVNSSQNFVFPTLAQLQSGGYKYNDDNREAKTISREVKLAQNFPNPFNPETNISFILPQNTNVQLNVYDISGKEVARLIDGYRIAGNYSVRFDASILPTGVYIYKLNFNGTSLVRKMMLIK